MFMVGPNDDLNDSNDLAQSISSGLDEPDEEFLMWQNARFPKRLFSAHDKYCFDAVNCLYF